MDNNKGKGGCKMFKMIRNWLDLFKDIFAFLRVRREQKEKYSPMIEDLDTINTLATALNDQIQKFSQKWNLFTETQKLIDIYKTYYKETQNICRETRRDILNNLLAERNKRLIDNDDMTALQVHRLAENNDAWESLVKVISQKNPLIGKMVGACHKERDSGVIYIIIEGDNKMFLEMLLRHRELIESACADVFGAEFEVVIKE